MNSTVVPPAQTLDNYSGVLYIPAAIFDNNNFGCDTSNADFAFIITKNGSNLKTNGNNGTNNLYTTTKTDIKDSVANYLETEQLFDANINISPNPSSGIFEINMGESETDQIDITIYNSIGATVLFNKTNNNKTVLLDLTGTPKGVYFLKISDNGINKFFKLIVS
ncbi:MAG: T9SS type A sorting domain-containing protein [Bacteroidota bacterium]